MSDLISTFKVFDVRSKEAFKLSVYPNIEAVVFWQGSLHQYGNVFGANHLTHERDQDFVLRRAFLSKMDFKLRRYLIERDKERVSIVDEPTSNQVGERICITNVHTYQNPDRLGNDILRARKVDDLKLSSCFQKWGSCTTKDFSHTGEYDLGSERIEKFIRKKLLSYTPL